MPDLTGIVLAGGKSRRMGEGVDKPLLSLKDRPMLEHVIAAIEPLCSTIIVIGRASAPLAASFANLKFLPDDIADLGPLGGLLTGLRNSDNELNLVVAADMPLLKAEVLYSLIEFKQETDVVAAVTDRVQPLCAVYNRTVLPLIESQIEKGKLSLMALLDNVEVTEVKIEDRLSLKDVDTPDDLETIKAALER
jgi:molybdopterin-guanine dinucleotide biosynthesis protein A